MVLQRLIRYVVALASFGVLLWGCWPSGQYEPSVVFHGPCSTQLSHEIIHTCSAHMHDNAVCIIETLRLQFPIIDQVTIRYQADGSAHIECTLQSPVVKIDGQHCITQAGLLVDSSWYDLNSMNNCVSIATNDLDRIARQGQEVIYFAHAIDKTVAKNYSIQWKDRLEIILTNKHAPLTIVSRYDYMLDQSRFALVEKVCTEKLGIKGQKKNSAVLADTRFEQQLIVRESVRRG